jgi:hypothetical protein
MKPNQDPPRIECDFAPAPLVAFRLLREGTITASAFVLLTFLFNRRKPGGWTWASNEFLARELGASKRTVTLDAGRLVEAGLMDRRRAAIPQGKPPIRRLFPSEPIPRQNRMITRSRT